MSGDVKDTLASVTALGDFASARDALSAYVEDRKAMAKVDIEAAKHRERKRLRAAYDEEIAVLEDALTVIGEALWLTDKFGTGEYADVPGLCKVASLQEIEENARAVPQPMDSILAREAPAGNVGIIHEGQRVCLGQRTVLIRPDQSKVDPWFLNYYLNAPRQRHRLLSNANGATVSHVNMPIIRNLPVDMPSMAAQRRIASVLMAYDNLIENNRRQIALLEETAQRLYKEWFVDLRFPGHEDVELFDGLPAGWSRVTIEELGTYLNGYAFKPSDHFTEGLPILKIKELRGGITKDTPRNGGTDIPDKYRIHHGDIVFSWSATLVVDIWDDEDALLNQHLFKVTPNRPETHEFVVQALSNLIEEMHAMTTGSTMTHLQRNKLKVITTLMPSDSVLEQYNLMAVPLRRQITTLKRGVKLIQEARDRLLPKLMSGEIEV